MFFFWFLFFKKKTAYDVRIMDCSSDVCSSDLLGAWFGVDLAVALAGDTLRWVVAGYCYLAAAQLALSSPRPLRAHDDDPHGASLSLAGVGIGAVSAVVGIGGGSMTVPLLVWRGVDAVRAVGTSRSEEHTSELQSLMRISYAVFCLQTKKK